VEHARHIGRPQPSHHATAGFPGWRSHRSKTLDERSSGGTQRSVPPRPEPGAAGGGAVRL